MDNEKFAAPKRIPISVQFSLEVAVNRLSQSVIYGFIVSELEILRRKIVNLITISRTLSFTILIFHRRLSHRSRNKIVKVLMEMGWEIKLERFAIDRKRQRRRKLQIA